MTGGRKRTAGLLCLLAVAAVVGCGAVSGSGSGTPELPPVQNDRGPAAYSSVVNDSFELLNEYWSREFADRDVAYEPPAALVLYWKRSQDKGCDGHPGGVDACLNRLEPGFSL